jgi:hypothetical protein
MKRRTKIAVVCLAIAGGITLFLFAPVVYWFSLYGPLQASGQAHEYNVYRSLGCVTIGMGDTYGGINVVSAGQTIQSAFQLSCNRPIIPP